LIHINFDFVVLGWGPVGRYAYSRLADTFPEKSIAIIDGSEGLKELASCTIVRSNIEYQGNNIRHSLEKLPNSSIWGGAMMPWPREYLYDTINKKENLATDFNSILEYVCKLLDLTCDDSRGNINLGNHKYTLMNAEILKDKLLSKFIGDANVKDYIVTALQLGLNNKLRIQCRQLKGGELVEIECDKVFLCLGTLENSRLLMTSQNILDERLEKSVGNSLTDHLNLPVSTFWIHPLNSYFKRFLVYNSKENREYWPRLVNTSRLINCDFFLHFREVEKRLFHSRYISYLWRLARKLGVRKIEVLAFFEKQAETDSKLSIEDGKLVIDFFISESEIEQLIEVHGEIIDFLKSALRFKLSRFQPLCYDSTSILRHISDTLHPAGTVSLSSNTKKKVLNSDLSLKSNSNVYVYGASSFPRSSATHPTLTALVLIECSIRSMLNSSTGQ
jgi:hypothetical protein